MPLNSKERETVGRETRHGDLDGDGQHAHNQRVFQVRQQGNLLEHLDIVDERWVGREQSQRRAGQFILILMENSKADNQLGR